MKKIKASVLIANYNNQKYINDCLRSLVKQTYKNFEIIFHDDNSKDGSIVKVKKFKKVKIIKNKKKRKIWIIKSNRSISKSLQTLQRRDNFSTE